MKITKFQFYLFFLYFYLNLVNFINFSIFCYKIINLNYFKNNWRLNFLFKINKSLFSLSWIVSSLLTHTNALWGVNVFVSKIISISLKIWKRIEIFIWVCFVSVSFTLSVLLLKFQHSVLSKFFLLFRFLEANILRKTHFIGCVHWFVVAENILSKRRRRTKKQTQNNVNKKYSK